MTEPYTLIEHRDGTLYALIDSPIRLSEAERAQLGREIARQTGRQVLGVTDTIPTQSSSGPGANYNILMSGFQTPANTTAMGSVLRAHGDASPNVGHPAYASSNFGHLLYTEQVQLLQVQEPRSATEAKIMAAIERSYKYMPGEVAERMRAFLTPQTVATIAGTLAVYAVAHAFGVAFILDIILGVLALVAVGTLAVEAFFKFLEFYDKASNATTDADLEEAAKLFADVVLTIGITATGALLTRRSLTPAGRREMDQSVLNRALSGEGGAVKPQRTLDEVRGRVMTLENDIELIGPAASQAGRSLNLTDDVPFLLSKDWDDVFFVAAHSTQNSLQFYRTVERAGAMQPRALAVAMFRAGYRGGDVVLLACESGLNRALVQGVWRELSALGLTRPVGSIHAPRRAIIGGETVQPHPTLGWAQWETFSFN